MRKAKRVPMVRIIAQSARHESGRLPPGSNAGVPLSGASIAHQIHIGLTSDSPIRLEGLFCVFDQPILIGTNSLIPIAGTLEQLLTGTKLEYLILDLSGAESGIQVIQAIRRACPETRLLAIGPPGDDELAAKAIFAGARAYLDWDSDFDHLQHAIEVVSGGSIWAPDRVLVQLIDQLLKVNDSSLTHAPPHFTVRELEVVELILTAQSNRAIARRLGIGEQSVAAHVSRMMRKTRTANRIQLSTFMRNL